MPETANARLFKEALSLDERERAELAGLLLESLEPGSDEDIEEAWQMEVRRRAEEIDSGKSVPIPWEVVRERIMKGYRD